MKSKREMSDDDRGVFQVVATLVSVVALRRQSLKVIIGLLATIVALAESLSADERIVMAEEIRDLADRVEYARERVRV